MNWLNKYIPFQKGHTIFKGAEKGWFKKDQKPWNTGRKMSEEARKKMSNAKLGYIPWNKGLKSWTEKTGAGFQKGKLNPGWKGGIGRSDAKTKFCPECGKLIQRRSQYCKICANTGTRSKFWKHGLASVNWTEREIIKATTRYKKWRIAVFERDNYICQKCGIRGTQLHADHIKSFAKFPELRFEINNGRTLCIRCHRKTDNYGLRALYV